MPLFFGTFVYQFWVKSQDSTLFFLYEHRVWKMIKYDSSLYSTKMGEKMCFLLFFYMMCKLSLHIFLVLLFLCFVLFYCQIKVVIFSLTKHTIISFQAKIEQFTTSLFDTCNPVQHKLDVIKWWLPACYNNYAYLYALRLKLKSWQQICVELS